MSKKHPLILVILGPPGSGKGTQTNFLLKKFKLDYIGSGELLRTRKQKKDYTGKKIAQTIDNGKRVATPVIFRLWMGRLEGLKNKKGFNGFVIDGSPRTKFEAEMLEMALEWYEWDKHKKAIFIDLSEKEAIKRLIARKMCKKCKVVIPCVGKFKHLEKCEKCGGKLVAREDDTKNGIKERLRWYKEEVRPAINYFRKRGELTKVNGDQSIEDVEKDIMKVLKK